MISKQGYERAQSLASELVRVDKEKDCRSLVESVKSAWDVIKDVFQKAINSIKNIFNDIKEFVNKEDKDISYTWHVPLDTTVKSQFYIPVSRYYKARSGI